MEILLVLAVGTLNVACFLIGVKVGQQASKGEPVEVKIPNPLKVVQEQREKKEMERRQEKMEVLLQNIESYDGTGAGQKDIPM